MNESFEYWITRRGIRRGQVPNRTKYLWASYVRFMKREGESETLTFPAFSKTLKSWGVEKRRYRGMECFMLNKAIVPKSSLSTKI